MCYTLHLSTRDLSIYLLPYLFYSLYYHQVYDRLGDAGVKVAANSVIDHKYIIIQMIVYYSSSMIFAFLMTFSESSGDAMVTSIFGLISTTRTCTFICILYIVRFVTTRLYHTTYKVYYITILECDFTNL